MVSILVLVTILIICCVVLREKIFNMTAKGRIILIEGLYYPQRIVRGGLHSPDYYTFYYNADGSILSFSNIEDCDMFIKTPRNVSSIEKGKPFEIVREYK